ncbi:DUF4336 domain-containing protein [Thalassotalea marina]|uniref:DUF4336 domain-containing protein n=1 Tax=Thalassotalea marina TaxID=1673741 RepID=A0A919BFD9_9GAMM|nr:DUF4336 domain-containing protein [Thalassotalea marina]GHF85232.1 hypothetical protein GCM10017161_10980 [Thalassotalea marina]
MRQLAENIWIVDGAPVQFLGFPYSTRMTVIRLSNGLLWIHSPIKLTDDLKSFIQQLGEVKYLIAPNHLHHLFLSDWQESFNVELYGTDEVIKKRKDISFDGSLNEQRAWPWQDDIVQEMFTGSPAMQECVFFHQLSKTLIVTDLVENFSPHTFSGWRRWVAKYAGILAPHGKMPIDWRLSFMFGKSKARKHFSTIMSWQPHILVMAHGEVIEQQTEQFLMRSFNWLN